MTASTLLARLRTALTLIAGAVVLAQLAQDRPVLPAIDRPQVSGIAELGANDGWQLKNNSSDESSTSDTISRQAPGPRRGTRASARLHTPGGGKLGDPGLGQRG